ncbi:MAG TPA: F0F1 ATP synthase subunit delta [Candidatus Peribacterales bacterium]|nr:F0F1 ATP synthase subunit delta [Candidatus Peribacterales bacterium]
MTTAAHDLARAALAALAEALEKEGLSTSPKDLEHIILQALSDRTGTMFVTIKTPSGSSGELATKVKTIIKEKTGKHVEIIEQKDPSIIGGAVISYGDERIDFSLQRALSDAFNILSETA